MAANVATVGFPVLGMNAFASTWGALLPLRWYMAVLLGQAARGLPKDELYRGNSTGDAIALFAAVLDARFAADTVEAIAAWRRAVAIQDRFAYHEPAPFYYPVRESLGGALIDAARHAEAERTFREDLSRNKRNGRSLFGLWQALAAQKREREAERAHQDFLRAWSSSDVTVTLAQF